MTPENKAWQRLVAASRGVRDERTTEAPYGFSTRVAALGMAGARVETRSAFERFSWRAVAVACLLALASVATDYSGVSDSMEDDILSDDNTVAALFDSSAR